MRGSRHLILVCLLAACAALPSPAGAAAPPDFAGIVAEDVFAATDVQPAYQDKEFGEMQAMGITLIRQTFDWARIERTRGNYDFSHHDMFVMAAARHGVRILPILFNPPKFRSSRPKRGAIRGTYFPKRYSDLGDFGVAVARRYGVNGTFWQEHPSLPKMAITSFQIWNEPNLRVYDPPKPNPKRYAKLLKAAAAKIRAAEPTAEIVSAGFPESKLSTPVNMYKWLGRMYRAGAAKSFDTLAINPYGKNAKQVMRNVKKARKLMNRNGHRSGKLWVTEIGWSDVGPRSPQRVGAKGQARNIGSIVAKLWKARSSLNLRGFVYFSWMDGRPYSKELGDFWGLHTGLKKVNGAHKPAYDALKAAIGKL